MQSHVILLHTHQSPSSSSPRVAITLACSASPTTMDRLSTSSFRLPRTPFGLTGSNLYVAVAAASLGSLIVLRSLAWSSQPNRSTTLSSPADTLLPTLEVSDLKELPYPPFALPGSRDIPSPYGNIRVYEWGPEEGERILLIHGISTPSIALTDVAHKLVRKGHRVLLFGTWQLTTKWRR